MKFDKEIIIRSAILPIAAFFFGKSSETLDPMLAAAIVGLIGAVWDLFSFFIKSRKGASE